MLKLAIVWVCDAAISRPVLASRRTGGRGAGIGAPSWPCWFAACWLLSLTCAGERAKVEWRGCCGCFDAGGESNRGVGATLEIDMQSHHFFLRLRSLSARPCSRSQTSPHIEDLDNISTTLPLSGYICKHGVNKVSAWQCAATWEKYFATQEHARPIRSCIGRVYLLAPTTRADTER